MMRLSYSIITLFILLLMMPQTAWADHDDPFIQVTCSPELNYFSLRTFYIEDSKIWHNTGNNKTNTSINKIGIYKLEDFSKANYHCHLPDRDISFDLIYFLSDSKCGANNADFSIKINNISIYKFKAFSESCQNTTDILSMNHNIEFTNIADENGKREFSLIKDCEYPEMFFYEKEEPREMACKSIDLSKLDKTP